MKKSKFVLTCAVGLLSIGVLATTIALYSNSLDKTISITGEVLQSGNYTLSDPEQTNTLGLTSTLNIKSYLGMTKPEGSSYNQNIVGGKISIEIGLPDAESVEGDRTILDFIDVKATVEGYEEGTIMDGTKFEFSYDSGTHLHTSSIETFFETDTNKNFVNIDISVKKDTSESDYLNYVANKSLTYKITLDETTEYEYAYVIGVNDNWNADDSNIYRMVPNIGASKYEWMYSGFVNQDVETIKVKIGNAIYPSAEPGSEITVNPGTHDIYFKPEEGNDIYISNN